LFEIFAVPKYGQSNKEINVFVKKGGIELFNLFEYIQGYWWICKFIRPLGRGLVGLAEYF
jgi:hypothetical protein